MSYSRPTKRAKISLIIGYVIERSSLLRFSIELAFLDDTRVICLVINFLRIYKVNPKLFFEFAKILLDLILYKNFNFNFISDIMKFYFCFHLSFWLSFQTACHIFRTCLR